YVVFSCTPEGDGIGDNYVQPRCQHAPSVWWAATCWLSYCSTEQTIKNLVNHLWKEYSHVDEFPKQFWWDTVLVAYSVLTRPPGLLVRARSGQQGTQHIRN